MRVSDINEKIIKKKKTCSLINGKGVRPDETSGQS